MHIRFDKRLAKTVLMVSLVYWITIALPMWWFFVAFGAPVVPSPPVIGPIDLFYLSSFYIPLAAILATGIWLIKNGKSE
jgi:hypothetical protein